MGQVQERVFSEINGHWMDLAKWWVAASWVSPMAII
jgi:hypothetical protein